MTLPDLVRFAREHSLAVVSSVGPEGTPQSALVGIAISNSLEIIFDTVSMSRKYANLTARPACSFVIGWMGEITMQYEGVAELPTGDELRRYQEIYFAKWPDGRDRLNWKGICHFVVHPKWVRYSDFSGAAPVIEEFSF